MKLIDQEAALEAVLFALGEAVPLAKLAAAAGVDAKTARALLKNLSDKYAEENRGIRVIEADGAFQMCTDARFIPNIEGVLRIPPKRALTQALLETLAIVAYRQPVTKAQIEEIRGVNADHAVNKLMEYGLIDEAGRQDAPGRPILFATTGEFLKHYGYAKLADLPPLSGDAENLRAEAEKELSLFDYA